MDMWKENKLSSQRILTDRLSGWYVLAGFIPPEPLTAISRKAPGRIPWFFSNDPVLSGRTRSAAQLCTVITLF